MRGAARISYWIYYEGGKITPLKEEIKDIKWVKEKNFENLLLSAGFTKQDIRMLLIDWEDIIKEFSKYF